MAEIETYRHSGKMGPAAIPYALGAGLVAAGALAWIYQALIDWIPFVYLNILATAGYGIAVGIAVGFAFRTGKGRNLSARTWCSRWALTARLPASDGTATTTAA